MCVAGTLPSVQLLHLACSDTIVARRSRRSSIVRRGGEVGVRRSRRCTVRCVARFFEDITKNIQLPPVPGSNSVDLGPFTVSQIGCGTWAWGNQFLWGYNPEQDGELREVFELCVDKGVNLFDTGDSYGTGQLNGRSESLLGSFKGSLEPEKAKRVRIATKFAAYPWRITPGSMIGACKASIDRLGVDAIDIGQMHWSTAKYQPFQERALLQGLGECYQEGLIRSVGLSNYGPKQLRIAHRQLSDMGVPITTLQVQYSLLNRQIDDTDLQYVCKELGVQLISYSPLSLGALTGKYDEKNLPSGARGLLFRSLLPKLRPLLEVLKEVSIRRKKSMSQVAINWCICKGTIPIPGARDLSQAKENIGAMGWQLSTSEISALDDASDLVQKARFENVFMTR